MTIAKRLAFILQKIASLEQQYHREAGCVTLVAVSKQRTTKDILLAYHEGQRAFGENYLQEAIAKIEALKTYNLDWHFIGRIQSNKTRDIAKYFNWVHSVDHYKIAEKLHQQRPEKLPALNICLQVNIDNEASKSGVKPELLLALANQIVKLDRINLRGLMVIPKITGIFDRQFAVFKRVNALQKQLETAEIQVDTLSMGMSHDYQAALAAGSTM